MSAKEREKRIDLAEHAFLRCAACPFSDGLSKRRPLLTVRCRRRGKIVLVTFDKAAACARYERLLEASVHSGRPDP